MSVDEIFIFRRSDISSMPSVIKQQMYIAIANTIKRYYNRHGFYEYSSSIIEVPASPRFSTMTNSAYGKPTDESIIVEFKSKFTPRMKIRLPPITEIGSGDEWTIVDITSSDHHGEMIEKIRTAIEKKMLVGEIKLVSERTRPIHVVMKMKRVGEKISTRTVSTEVVE